MVQDTEPIQAMLVELGQGHRPRSNKDKIAKTRDSSPKNETGAAQNFETLEIGSCQEHAWYKPPGCHLHHKQCLEIGGKRRGRATRQT